MPFGLPADTEIIQNPSAGHKLIFAPIPLPSGRTIRVFSGIAVRIFLLPNQRFLNSHLNKMTERAILLFRFERLLGLEAGTKEESNCTETVGTFPSSKANIAFRELGDLRNLLQEPLMTQLALVPAAAAGRIISLRPLDLAIIVIYFIAVLGIGFYLRNFAKSGEDFFVAGREMTAWVAGLSFLSANLGSLELLGWAGAAYQYGILAAHWYWLGAIPAMLFLAIIMMPFYYISRTHSVPGYLQLRFDNATSGLSAITFAVMTILMSGVNMYAMAVVMKVVLGWNIHFSIWVSSLTVGVYVALGGLYSAIFNEVLQFFLIWLGALLIPILGLMETGGWSGMVARIHKNFPGKISPTSGAAWDTSPPTRWAFTGRESSSGWLRCWAWATGQPTFWWCRG